ncbi:MAG TPA: type II toxin-antitoxin system RelE/ParE family toxin [Alphaproteobacteria bacterium]|jgi:plasmid stabilization system protein ParE
MKVRYRERALADLDEISGCLTQRSPTGARNVLKAIHVAVADIAAHPQSARRTSDPSVRVKIVGRYRYQIFYSVEADSVEILHLRHGARRPWVPAQQT